MRYEALICDYDGTIATGGRVAAGVVDDLERVRESGRRLVLATGRVVSELLGLFPDVSLFDLVVGENGAVLYWPKTGDEKLLAGPPPAKFFEALKSRGLEPISLGRVVIGTAKPHDIRAMEVIRQMGLELTVLFNKSSVMILPTGVSKATGLGRAFRELGILPREAVGVGDAENDHAMLRMCGCGAALENAVDSLKETADVVLTSPNGRGVRDLIDRLLADILPAPRQAATAPTAGRPAN